jgi:hypothetical protein
MKFKFELDDDQVLSLFEKFVNEQESDDTINSLSIIFDKYEGGDNEVYQPSLFFYPNWEFDFEVRLPLVDALEEYLEQHEGEDYEEFADQRTLVKRLLAVTEEWITQQKLKEEAP